MEDFDKLQEALDTGGGKQARTLPQRSQWAKHIASGFPSGPGPKTANSLWFVVYIYN